MATGIALQSTSNDAGADLDSFRQRVRALISECVLPLVSDAERTRCFPRAAIAQLGAQDIFRERWDGAAHGNMYKAAILTEELARSDVGGVGMGISLHLEVVISILRRYATNAFLRDCLEDALDGAAVGCFAASEQQGGSDLAGIRTTLSREGSRLRVRGSKWFVSPGTAADFALVLARNASSAEGHGGGTLPPLSLVLVPREGFHIEKVLETAGTRSLGTSRLSIDSLVPEDAILGRCGAGLAVATWGLTHERLAVATGALAAALLAVELARTHAERRTQFGRPLFEHQALRFRLADLYSRLRLMQRGVRSLIPELMQGEAGVCNVAGAKVAAAHLAEHSIREALHVFGGSGYLEDETPLARMLRDVRISRLGSGTDEIMWELVAADMHPVDDLYDRLVHVAATEERP